jgi:tripartite-type tricarboxylate transporter receptor subunit TctC
MSTAQHRVKLKPLLRTLFFSGLALTAGIPAMAEQPLDCRDVVIVSPYAPGGTTDILARLIAPDMQSELGVPVIVTNKPGASSNIGTEFVSRAKPDGCTLLMGNNTGVVINRNLYQLRHDPLHSLAPVGEVAAIPLVLYVNPSKMKATTTAELIDELKKNPRKYSFASAGSGSPQHLAGELIKQRSSVEMLHVPYKGSGPAVSDVIAGHVPISFDTTAVLLPHIKAGTVRPLATTSPKRTKVLPNIPTMTESGFSNFVIENWYGVFAPAETPKPLIERLNKAVNTALRSPRLTETLDKLGSADVAGTAQQFSDFIAKEAPVWTEVVQKSGVKID